MAMNVLNPTEPKHTNEDGETSTYLKQALQEQHNILYLNYKRLRHVPRSLVTGNDFICIKHLYLRNNCLEELPDTISNLHNLQTLYLHSNKLKSLPSGLSKCTELQNLDISDNVLQEVPACVCYLPNLHTLRINDNRIKTISKEIRNLKTLRALYLRSNLITHVPREITECHALKMIVMDCNRVSSLPRELVSLNPLSLQLFVHTNNLTHVPFGLAEVVKDLFIDRNPHLHGLALNDISLCRSINHVVHPSFYNQCEEDSCVKEKQVSNCFCVKTICNGKTRKIYLPTQIEHCIIEETPSVPPLLEIALRAVHTSLADKTLSAEDAPHSLRQISPVAQCGMCHHTSVFTYGYLILYECSGVIQHLDLPFRGLAYSLLCTYKCLTGALWELHQAQVPIFKAIN